MDIKNNYIFDLIKGLKVYKIKNEILLIIFYQK